MTVMNMLIGVLCDVVTAMAHHEKDASAVKIVHDTVQALVHRLDEDDSGLITKDEMCMLLEDEAALGVLGSLKVDVTYLVDFLDMNFEKSDVIPITKICALILTLRGDRYPSMKDLL